MCIEVHVCVFNSVGLPKIKQIVFWVVNKQIVLGKQIVETGLSSQQIAQKQTNCFSNSNEEILR